MGKQWCLWIYKRNYSLETKCSILKHLCFKKLAWWGPWGWKQRMTQMGDYYERCYDHLRRKGQELELGWQQRPWRRKDITEKGKDGWGQDGKKWGAKGTKTKPGVRNGNLFQYSCLGKSMDRGGWRATVHGFPKSQTWLKGLNNKRH